VTAALDENHRQAQLRLGSQTILALSAVWPLLDPHDLDATAPGWLTAVVPIVQRFRLLSSALAAAYLRIARTDELGEELAPALAADVPPSAIATSMLVTGPYSIKANTARRAVPLGRALGVAEARSGAAGMRHALNGGRETIVETMKADPRARGWRRVASGRACPFCSSLAGQESFTSETISFQAHDACGCSAAPVYA
jgi:hypothetical protein